MSDIIHLLPDSLANQIAAGEVVQRPASAIKELLENAIDAGSTQITLIVKEAGKQLIQVIDNGTGMSETDARMSFERHATSKIKETQDLFTIRTHGFRGEALASIAAIAQVELKSKRGHDELGTLIKIEGSDVKLQEATTCEQGTSVCVKNLFYNVPARRNFLKSNPVELRHVVDEFQRVALAYPSIGFTFFQNDLEVFRLLPEKLSHRIVGIFGKTYKEQLIPCHEETHVINIKGYIGKPEHAKKNRGEQFFFVNNRFIKHNYLHHAVMNAYEEIIDQESYPFYVIFIEIDPKHIDINVHPTKTEIKFDDERTIYHTIRAAIKKSLATYNVTPSIDFGIDINFGAFSTEGQFDTIDHNKDNSSGSSLSRHHTDKSANLTNWEALYKGFQNDLGLTPATEILPEETSLLSGDLYPSKPIFANEPLATFQLHQTYIVSQVKSGMMIIDQQAAHERIIYEKYHHLLNSRSGGSQQLLFPITIEFSPLDFMIMMEMEVELKMLGFSFTLFGKNTVILSGIPADIPQGNEKNLFEGLIEQYKYFKADLQLDKQENLLRSLAKRASLKAGTKLTQIEMNTLIDQLFACSTPNYGPSGNTTIVLLDMMKINKLFSR